MRNRLAVAAMVVGLAAAPAASSAAVPTTRAQLGLQEEIRHELVMLPWLGVFDHLQFKVDGYKVTLLGQVSRPTLRADAERVVRRIEGVEQIDNRIEVLPLSPFDDRIRLATYRAIYGYGPLQRYGLGAQAPIRIVVKNGNVTLAGVVANEMDRNLANIRANGVSGVFSVENQLQVEQAR